MFRLKFSAIPGNPMKLNREFIGNPIDEFSEMYERFTSLYAIKNLIADDELHKRPLKAKKDRVCKFCKAIFNEQEKFKSKAHLLPELIGNKNLLSDFECDKCNNFFGRKYENDFANYLGASRAFNIENAKSGGLKFKSPDKTFIVMKDTEVPLNLPKLRIESHEEENNHFTLDADNKKVTFHTTRPSYNPHNVYKAFLKIGLSVLPHEYDDDYKIAFAMLRSEKKNEEKDDPLFKLNVYVHPGPVFPSPMVILFEKKVRTDLIPTHIVCIMFHNYTYQLVLPLNEQDKWMFDGKKIITVPNMPPFIDKHFAAKFGMPKGHRLNFNLDELKRNEKHDITFSFDDYKDSRFNE
ncbi:MAG: hypothetical protein KF825_06390 [Ferruginibacter sp.]|nr:hypothetical protein [Ferruginibacter sp.]